MGFSQDDSFSRKRRAITKVFLDCSFRKPIISQSKICGSAHGGIVFNKQAMNQFIFYIDGLVVFLCQHIFLTTAFSVRKQTLRLQYITLFGASPYLFHRTRRTAFPDLVDGFLRWSHRQAYQCWCAEPQIYWSMFQDWGMPNSIWQ